jgi:hypothetical protein
MLLVARCIEAQATCAFAFTCAACHASPLPLPACLQRQPGSQGKTNWHKT